MALRDDRYWMLQALQLATHGFTHPNPMVGCILVRDGIEVGGGFHLAAGQPHAEVEALRSAGGKARGATAYVTLEPCSHYGRTPPCADALIAAGITRVVAAVEDPNPKVAGSGLTLIRKAGIETAVGLCEAEARELNAAFFHFHTYGEPLVTLKAAMSLDGKIATRTGSSRWVTGMEARREVHRLRAQSGAVLTGIGSLLADGSRLDARLPDVTLPRQPLRIIVDSRLRTPVDAPAVILARDHPEKYPLLIACGAGVDLEREQQLKLPGVEVLRLPENSEGRVDLPALMKSLAGRQINSVLAEGGAELNAGLLAARVAHRALIFMAPKLVGGRSAPGPIGGEGISFMSEALPVGTLKVHRYGDDIALLGEILYPDAVSSGDKAAEMAAAGCEVK